MNTSIYYVLTIGYAVFSIYLRAFVDTETIWAGSFEIYRFQNTFFFLFSNKIKFISIFNITMEVAMSLGFGFSRVKWSEKKIQIHSEKY